MIKQYRCYKRAWVFAHDPHLEKKLSSDEVNTLLTRGGMMVRNAYDFDCKEETSFWYVIKDSFGGMEELSSKMRNQVKRSLKQLDIRKVSKDEMLAYGYEVHKSAAESYKVKAEVPTKEGFEKRITRAGSVIDFGMTLSRIQAR